MDLLVWGRWKLDVLSMLDLFSSEAGKSPSTGHRDYLFLLCSRDQNPPPPFPPHFPATATSHWDKLGSGSGTEGRTTYIYSNYPDQKGYRVENMSNPYFPSAIGKQMTNFKYLHRPEQKLHCPTAFAIRCGLCLSSAQDHSVWNACHCWGLSSERNSMYALASSSSLLPARM